MLNLPFTFLSFFCSFLSSFVINGNHLDGIVKMQYVYALRKSYLKKITKKNTHNLMTSFSQHIIKPRFSPGNMGLSKKNRSLQIFCFSSVLLDQKVKMLSKIAIFLNISAASLSEYLYSSAAKLGPSNISFGLFMFFCITLSC